MVQNIRNLGGFFSEYYLGQLKESKLKVKLGENTSRQNFRKISKLYEKAELRLNQSSPKHEIIDRWIIPLLQILGFEENKNLLKRFSIETEKESLTADFAFFPVKDLNELNENELNGLSPILLFDIYSWETTLGQKLGRGYDNTPLKKMRNKIAFSNAKWGIILNGPMIWLLKQQEGLEEQSFLEIDLNSIVEEYDETSFEIFWALFRADAFYPDGDKPSLIETIDIESRSQAAKVGEFLRDNVYQALEAFMRGILEDSSNEEILKRFELKDIYHQALLFMYRLLFIFYAESLELIPISHDIYRDNYSLENIRILIEDPSIKFNANQYYLWKSLQSLFKMLDLGIDNGDLRVTAFNGYLFSSEQTPILEQIEINDKVLQNVISLLSTTPAQKYRGKERISYKELGVAQLGAIYEGLLEYEPKIAEEDLIIKKIKGNPIVVPVRLDTEENSSKNLGEISNGQFYLSIWGGSRKSSGTYYTPDVLTKFLVEQALKLLVEGKNSDEILKIKILDPAMGSGAFLVAACNFLAEYYGQALIDEGKIENNLITSKAAADHRRLIAENCLYGIDLNPMAVELAKVSIWITTAADQKPLNFLDHRLVVGNSLIGCKLEDIEYLPNKIFSANIRKQNNLEIKGFKKKQRSLDFWFGSSFNLKSEIKNILKFRGEEFLSGSDTDRNIVQNKYRCLIKLTSKASNYSKIKQIFDIWCAGWFWENSNFPTTRIFQAFSKKLLENRELNENEREFLNQVESIKEKYKFFHVELEFPEIFFNSKGILKADPGFDAIISNPPWDKIKPEKNSFFTNYYPLFKELTPEEKKEKIKELLKIKQISDNWESHQASIRKLSYFIRESNYYQLRGEGDLNYYKLFLEKNLKISNSLGFISLVLPTSFNTDLGVNLLRKTILNDNRLNYLLCLSNERYLFQGVAHNFKFCLFSLQKGGSTNSFHSVFKYDINDSLSLKDAAYFLSTLPKTELFNLEVALIKKLDPENYVIFEFKNKLDIEILTKSYLRYPSLSDAQQPWGVFYKREIDMTNDNSLFNSLQDGFPLLEGRMLYSFDDRYKKWISGRARSAKWKTIDLEDRKINWNPQWWISIDNLKEKGYTNLNWRVGFNDVTGPTNFRSIKACLISPKMICGNALPVLEIINSKNEKDRKKICLYLISILNSFVLDYCVRVKVKNHLSKFIILSLPIPYLENNNWIFNQIIIRAARLICYDEEFKEFWEDIFTEEWMEIDNSGLSDWKNITKEWKLENSVYGRMTNGDDSYDSGDRAELRAEIDALIAHLFELSYDEFERILDTFPVLKNKEEAIFGEFQSKKLCLQEFEHLKPFIEDSKNSLEEITN